MFVSEISSDELHALPLVRFPGNIHIIETLGQAESVAGQLNACPVLGFDTETRPSFTKGRVNKVALLQLSTDTDAYLFRFCKIEIPRELILLLANPNILKIGVAIKNDIDTLHRVAKIQPRGFIDLQNMVQKFHIKNIGLAKMAGIVLGVRISKSQQLSNWENVTLTEAQECYAATDAWACYKIYEKLNHLIVENQFKSHIVIK